MGTRLIPVLVERGHRVRAVARPGSESRMPAGCESTMGNVLDGRTYTAQIAPADTFVHLVGTPRPSPAKARQFREIDLVSAREAVRAAVDAGIAHFVYVSVAHPAPIMRAYIAARAEAEHAIRAAGLRATIIRPWYVLGPGHRWPHLLRPAYWLLERLPSTREAALRLGLVTIDQMIRTLLAAVENPPERGVRVIDVEGIRATAADNKPQRRRDAEGT
jgi:nucleoside-diphosphate-sugar epimerase